MIYDEFAKWALAQPKASYLDYDKAYGLQCVDLAKHYIKKVRGIEPQSIGNAIEYFKKRNSAYVQKIVEGGSIILCKRGEKIKPKKGDIVVFWNERNTSAGHIAIATGETTSTGFYCLDTNFVNGDDRYDKCERVLHSYTSTCWAICLLRMDEKYVGIDKAVKNEYYYVRTSGSNLYLRDKPNGNIIAKIKNGTKVKCVSKSIKGWLEVTAVCTDGKTHTGYASTTYLKQ